MFQGGNVPCAQIEVELELIELQPVDSTYLDSACGFTFAHAAPGPYTLHIILDRDHELRQPVEIGVSSTLGFIQVSMGPTTRVVTQSNGADSEVVDVSEFLDQYPKKAVSLYRQAIDSRKKNKQKAIKQLQQAIKIAPTLYQAHNDLGILYRQVGRLDDAESEFNRAHELNHSATAPLVNLGRLYLEEDKSKEALEVSQEAVDVNSRSAPALFNLGVALYKAAKLDMAEDALMRALSLAPKMFQIHLALANVYLKLRRFDRLVDQLDTYLQENPDGPEKEQVERLREQILKAKDNGR